MQSLLVTILVIRVWKHEMQERGDICIKFSPRYPTDPPYTLYGRIVVRSSVNLIATLSYHRTFLHSQSTGRSSPLHCSHNWKEKLRSDLTDNKPAVSTLHLRENMSQQLTKRKETNGFDFQTRAHRVNTQNLINQENKRPPGCHSILDEIIIIQ